MAAAPQERQKWVKAVEQVECFRKELGCSVCLYPMEDAHALPCSHCYCKTCIVRALKFNPQCPICKRDANKRHLRPDLQVASLLKNSEILLNQLHHIGKDL